MNDEDRAQGACPVCGKPATEERKPFCSARCAMVDLGRWLGGTYRIAAETGDDPEDAPDEDSGPG